MFVFVLISKLTNPSLFDLFSNKRNSGGLSRGEYDRIGLYLGPVAFYSEWNYFCLIWEGNYILKHKKKKLHSKDEGPWVNGCFSVGMSKDCFALFFEGLCGMEGEEIMPGKWKQTLVGLWYFGKMRGWERQAHAITVLGRGEERGTWCAPRMSKNPLVKEGYVGEGEGGSCNPGWRMGSLGLK